MPIFHAMMLKNSFPTSNLIKQTIMLAWKGFTDQVQRECAEQQLLAAMSSAAVRNAMNDISKKVKSELIVIAHRECGLTMTAAEKCDRETLISTIRKTRKALKDHEHEFLKKPKGFANMSKDELLAECKRRLIPLDTIGDGTEKDRTRANMKLAIVMHIDTATLLAAGENPQTTKANISDDEFVDVRAPSEMDVESNSSASTVSKNKRTR